MGLKNVAKLLLRIPRNLWRSMRIRGLEYAYAYDAANPAYGNSLRNSGRRFAYYSWAEMSFVQRDVACDALSSFEGPDLVEALYRWRDYPECPWRTKNHHGSDMVEFLPFELPRSAVGGAGCPVVHGTSRVQQAQRFAALYFAGLVRRWPGREAVLEADDWRDVYRIEADEDMPAETNTAK